MLNQYENIEKEIRMGMNLIERDEFTSTIKAISHIAAQTVGKTLGPYAHTTIIDDGNFTYPTKDGWSILQRLRFQDPTHNSIFNMLKNISFRIVDKVGDGTTTAMVTADHFIEAMSNNFSDLIHNYRQADIVDALNDVRDMVIADLNEHAIQIAPGADDENPTFDDIYNVAMISSNGNKQIANIMRSIYQQTKNPNMLVDMDGGTSIDYEIQTGYRLDCQFLMSERYSNTSEHYYDTHGNPHNIVIFDHNVTYQKHAEMIDCLINESFRQGRAIILMAPYFDDVISSIFATTVQDQMKKNPNAIPGLMVIQIPEMTRTAQRNAVNDFAALANVSVVNATKVKVFMEMRHNERADEDAQINDRAMDLDDYKFTTAQELIGTCYGTISHAVIGKNFITLSQYNKDSIAYKARMQLIEKEYLDAKKAIEHSPTSLTKEFLEASQRYNKMSGAIGVIHVGGITELERQCMRDVIDDTFLACRSAYENGVVAGLNLGALSAIARVSNCKTLSNLQKIALSILTEAYARTTTDILTNKKSGDDAMWGWDDSDKKLTADDLVYDLVAEMVNGNITSYDVISEKVGTERIPAVCNSVSTDIEILYGITGILGMVLTSDQYMSVSRMYDKTAAIRQQEALNEREMANKVKTILTAMDEYAKANGHPAFHNSNALPGMLSL